MNWYCKVFVAAFVLGSFTLVTAVNKFVPHDKEIIYDYKVVVQTGTKLPSQYVSEFMLHGNLHVQADNKATMVKLSDLKYYLFNGKVDDIHKNEVKVLEIADKIDLEKPFKIIHDPNGRVVGISTPQDEKPHTQNIKKSIASLMQLDQQQIDMKNMKHAHSSVSREHSIYGPSEVQYNVVPQKDNYVKVHKMHNFGSEFHRLIVSNTPLGVCDATPEPFLTQESQRIYLIKVQQEQPMVEYITAHGAVLYHPFNGKSEINYMQVNQTMILEEIVPITKRLVVENEKVEKDLTYDFYADEELKLSPHGNIHSHIEKLMPTVMRMFEDLSHHLYENHLQMETPDPKKEQLIDILRIRLMYFSVEDLENLHHMLHQSKVERSVKIFFYMLPLVGTRATTMYIMYLMENQQPDVIKMLLREMPSNLKTPNIGLLTELESLIDLDENKFDESVRKTAMLTFGSVVHKTYQHEKKMHILKNFQQIHDLEDSKKPPVTVGHTLKGKIPEEIEQRLEKYVKMFIQKFKNTENLNEQTTYIAVLFNMKLPSIVEHMMKMLEEETVGDHDKRLFIVLAMASSVKENPEMVSTIAWSLLSNHEEHTAIRMSAFLILMETQQTSGMLTNLIWMMLHEPNPELYKLQYTFIQSAASSKSPCMCTMRDQITRLMPYLHPPRTGMSFYYISDYKDLEYDFGMELHGAVMFTNDSVMVLMKMKSHVFNIATEDYKLFIQINDVENIKNMLTQFTNPMVFEKITKAHKEVQMKAVVLKKEEIVVAMVDTMEILGSLLADETLFSPITYSRFVEMTIPTDFGLPLMWNLKIPVVVIREVKNIMKPDETKFDLSINYKKNVYLTHYKHGLMMYNSIMDVYQGVERMHSMNVMLPMNMKMSYAPTQRTVNFSFKTFGDTDKDMMGMKSYVRTFVVLKNYLNVQDVPVVLRKSSPTSDYMVEVTEGHEFRSNYTLVDDKDLMLAKHWKVMAYDKDHHFSNGSWKHLIYSVTHPYTKNYQTPFDYVHMVMNNFYNRVLLQPEHGSHGLLVLVEPIRKGPMSTDITLRWNVDIKPAGVSYAPGMKLGTTATYTVRQETNVLKTWVADVLLVLNPGHTNNKMKMVLTRTVPGQKDYKICVDGTKKWIKDTVSQHLNIAAGQTSDDKCNNAETVIDVTMTGVPSHEQTEIHRQYGVCQHAVSQQFSGPYIMECMANHNSIRQYNYDIKTRNVPNEIKKKIANIWEEVKGWYIQHFTMDNEHDTHVEQQNLRVEVQYPNVGNQVDVHIYDPHSVQSLEAVSTDLLRWFGMSPDHVMYPEAFILAHNMGLTEQCEIHIKNSTNGHIIINGWKMEHEMPQEWKIFAQNEPAKQQISVKEVSGHLGVKITNDDKEMVVMVEKVPSGGVQFMVNNKIVEKMDEYYFEDWVTYKVLKKNYPYHPVMMLMTQKGVHAIIHEDSVELSLPKTKWTGECFHN